MKIRKRIALSPGRPTSDINITPLVDVVLVLLIIFMVVTPLLEKDIGVRVPSTEKVEEMSEVPPDQLVVKLDEAGALKINGEAVNEAEYVDKLRPLLARKGPKDKLVFIVAAEKTNYALVVHALDGAKQAGAEVLGMATDKPAEEAANPR